MSNQEEQSFRSRVHNAYHKLSRSYLVNREDTSEGSLTFFESRLNDALPRTDVEKDQVRIIKDLFHNAPHLTYRVITAERDGMSKQSMYVLWTNAWCITRHFKIEHLVTLEWDQQNSVYHVKAVESSSKSSESSSGSSSQKSPKTSNESSPATSKPSSPEPGTKRSDNWQTVDNKKYRPRRGKRNDRRPPPGKKQKPNESVLNSVPEPPEEPVTEPATAKTLQEEIAQAVARNDAWH